MSLESEFRSALVSIRVFANGRPDGAAAACDAIATLARIALEASANPLGETGRCEECTELTALFELQRTRMGEAVKAWRAAHPGTEDTWPDLGELLTWLHGEIESRGLALGILVTRTQGAITALGRVCAAMAAERTRCVRGDRPVDWWTFNEILDRATEALANVGGK